MIDSGAFPILLLSIRKRKLACAMNTSAACVLAVAVTPGLGVLAIVVEARGAPLFLMVVIGAFGVFLPFVGERKNARCTQCVAPAGALRWIIRICDTQTCSSTKKTLSTVAVRIVTAPLAPGGRHHCHHQN
jgi:uncharacterized RDD family membrane protein YckC